VTENWEAINTTTHQDHVIAHVVDSAVLAYLVFDETIYLLMDIEFIWSIYLDGQMVLLPYTVAVTELEIEPAGKAEIKNEIDMVLREEVNTELKWLTQPEAGFSLSQVSAYACGERRRYELIGENSTLIIETSLETGEIRVSER
jgi:hypothetical protein